MKYPLDNLLSRKYPEFIRNFIRNNRSQLVKALKGNYIVKNFDEFGLRDFKSIFNNKNNTSTIEDILNMADDAAEIVGDISNINVFDKHVSCQEIIKFNNLLSKVYLKNDFKTNQHFKINSKIIIKGGTDIRKIFNLKKIQKDIYSLLSGPNRTKNNKYNIVFSTDPWDIATMSMRGIDSCMRWGYGANSNNASLIGSILDPYCGIVYLTDNKKVRYGTRMLNRSVVRIVSKNKLFLEKTYYNNLADLQYCENSQFLDILFSKIKTNKLVKKKSLYSISGELLNYGKIRSSSVIKTLINIANGNDDYLSYSDADLVY